MDNITHTLIGLAAGECLAIAKKKPRKHLWIASAISNNLPDLDILATTFLFPGKLGYLLEHRGHTHTLLLAPVQSVLFILCYLAFQRRNSTIPWREVILLSFLGPFLHLAADYCNSYGVHPLWPWDNHWVYGDLLFILEPWIWVILIPPIFYVTKSIWGKGLLGIAFIGVFLAAWIHPMVPFFSAVGLTCVSLLWIVGRRLREGWRISIAILLIAFLLGSSKFVQTLVYQKLGPQTGEITLSPSPTNFFCWNGIHSRIEGSEYIATLFQFTPLPQFFPVRKCKSFSSETTAPIIPMQESTIWIRKWGEFRAPVQELLEISQYCDGKNFLRFARNPYWKKEQSGWVLGDLRFDHSKEIGFAELQISEAKLNCSLSFIPWVGKFFFDK